MSTKFRRTSRMMCVRDVRAHIFDHFENQTKRKRTETKEENIVDENVRYNLSGTFFISV